MGTISKDFSFVEFTKSETAKRLHINNEVCDWDVRDNIIALVNELLQPLRDAWGGPLIINSGYRCPELNREVGGVNTSQHLYGAAADVRCTDPVALVRLIKRLNLEFDQVILYNDFVHMSYRRDGENRMQILYSPKYRGPKV